MNRYHLLAIATACSMLLMWSCKEEAPEQPRLVFKDQKNEMTVPPEGGKYTIGIITNLDNLAYKVEVAKDLESTWLQVGLEASEPTIHIEVQKNESRSDRRAYIYVYKENISARLELTQTAQPAFISTEPSTIVFTAEGGSESITINSNVTWEVQKSEDATWLSIEQEEKGIKVTAEPFKKDETRTASLIVKGETVEKTIEVSQKGEAQLIGISIPSTADFNQSKVLAVYDGEVQIAEICREYLNIRGEGGINRLETVIYPMLDDKPDLSKGLLMSTGATIAWNLETNRATHTPLADGITISQFYFDGEKLLLENPNSIKVVKATVKPILLNDERTGTETVSYPIVKVGTQYWMGENLKTKKYRDGSSIAYKTIDEAWSTSEGAYSLPEGQLESAKLFGYWYNGHAVLSEKGLAPKGWNIPHNDDFLKLKSYLGTNAGTKVKSRTLWQDETPTNTTNLSGLGIMPAGHRAEGATQYMIGVRSYHWTSVKAKDILFNTEGLNYIMLNSGKTALYTSFTNQIHNLEAGHSVICVRE